MPEILVIGSLNMDLVVKTDRAPAAGESLHGTDFRMIPGGKGANQAAAAGRLGGNVALVGRVGADSFGPALRDNLSAFGVDVSQVSVDDHAPTGTATIIVDSDGENRIIVVAGANGRVVPQDIDSAGGLIKTARAVLLQFEIPLPVVEYAIQAAHTTGAAVILNPAPAYPVSASFLGQVDYLILNETELALLSGQPVTDINTAQSAARALHAHGVKVVILTMGAQGALLLEGERSLHIPTRPVRVVDTTAAGDTFAGAFTVALVQGVSLEQAVRYAVAAGTLAVTRFGAQSSIPSIDEVQSFMEQGEP